jgi:hypothetical protein
MMAFARSFARGLLAASIIGGLFVASCAKQGEGERCAFAANKSGDCESGLRCIEANELANSTIGDRCCPDQGEESDDRCIRKVSTGGVGGTGGTGGTGGAGGADGGAGTSGTAGSSGDAGASGSAGAAGNAGAGGTAGGDAGDSEASSSDGSSE